MICFSDSVDTSEVCWYSGYGLLGLYRREQCISFTARNQKPVSDKAF